MYFLNNYKCNSHFFVFCKNKNFTFVKSFGLEIKKTGHYERQNRSYHESQKFKGLRFR